MTTDANLMADRVRVGSAVYFEGEKAATVKKLLAEHEQLHGKRKEHRIALRDGDWEKLDTAVPDLQTLVEDIERLCEFVGFDAETDPFYMQVMMRIAIRALRSACDNELETLELLDRVIRQAKYNETSS